MGLIKFCIHFVIKFSLYLFNKKGVGGEVVV